jgi:hypothetical protein
VNNTTLVVPTHKLAGGPPSQGVLRGANSVGKGSQPSCVVLLAYKDSFLLTKLMSPSKERRPTPPAERDFEEGAEFSPHRLCLNHWRLNTMTPLYTVQDEEAFGLAFEGALERGAPARKPMTRPLPGGSELGRGERP